MSWKRPRPKNCAHCGEPLAGPVRIIWGEVKEDWKLSVVGWHMPEGEVEDGAAGSCYDQDEAVAHAVISDSTTLLETLAAIAKIAGRGKGRVIRARLLITSDMTQRGGHRPKRKRKTKRKRKGTR